MDPDWKQHRRGIEWRCRWLELRTKAINAKLTLYDKSLKSLQNSKIWKWEGEVGEGTSARTVPVKILRNHPVIHRKHRRRPEDAEGDLDLGRHPVFSRYGTKGDPESSFSVQVHCCLPGNSVIAALTSLSFTHVHYASCVLSRQNSYEIYFDKHLQCSLSVKPSMWSVCTYHNTCCVGWLSCLIAEHISRSVY